MCGAVGLGGSGGSRGTQLSQRRFPQPVTQVTWHGRGDYMAVVLAAAGHTQVLIHQLSRRRSQSPFRRSHGQVQRVAFHPVRPFLLVASQRGVRLYHLLRQELTKKLRPNCKWVSSLAVHPAGEGVVGGLLWGGACTPQVLTTPSAPRGQRHLWQL